VPRRPADWGDPEGRTRAPEDTPDDRDRADVQPPLGTRLGRYILLHPLGEGGMGVVYAARDPELDRKVALKLVRASGRRAQTRRARLLREAQALARLNHPNVVEVLDAGVVDARDWDPDADPPERVWIAMELVDADTLDLWQSKEQPGWRRILDVFVEAGRGLHAAHLGGLVHRDFKPENVLVSPDGRVRVTDFGLARPLGELEGERDDGDPTASRSNLLLVRLTKTGASIGTPAYMSPEQHRRESVDAKSDQFNFCVGLYEALYRRAPFEGADVKALARAVEAGQVRSPPARALVPARVFRVLRRGLAPRPDDRFESVDALLVALRSAARPRGRIALALGVGALVSTGVWVGWPEPSAAGCTAGSSPVDAVWNGDRASQLQAGLAASELPFATETWTRVEPRLQSYAAAWSDAYATTCAVDDAAIRDRRMTCLADAREKLDALLSGLASADPALVRDAVARVSGLPAVEACRDDARLSSEPELPSDPARRARIAAVRARLATVRAEEGARDYANLVVAAAEALAEAERIGWAPLIGAAHYHLGVLQQGAARHDDARASLEQAYFVAGEAGDGRTAARAAIHLAYLTGATRSQLDEGLKWARHARAAVAELGDAPDLEGAIATAEGEVHFRHGRYDEAFTEHTRAVELAEGVHGAESVEVAMGLNNLGNVMFKRGDPEGAARHYARALEIREQALGPMHPQVGASLSNLGSMERLLGREQDALAHLERSLAVMESGLGPDHPDVGNPLNSLFLLHSDRREWDLARAYIERALAIWTKSYGDEHPHVAIGRGNLGTLYLRLGRPRDAVRELDRAVEILEAVLGPEHPNVAFPLAALGRAWLDLHAPDKARTALERARALRQAQGEGSVAIAIVDARLAEADALSGGDTADALARGRAALAILREAGRASAADADEVEAWLQRAAAR
jgi:tetratricopeptide (TPR) repeat protein/tRNA A-37 threonylcarbamoyl transferase component Bud32